MGAIWKGKYEAQLVRVDRTRDPINGWTAELEYQGPEESIAGIEAGYFGNRLVSTRKYHDGPVHSIVVNFFSSGEIDPPTDSWTTSWDTLDKDIWGHPAVTAEAELYGVAKYKREILDAVEKGEDLDSGILSLGTPSVAAEVYRELSRGGTNYEDYYLVLKVHRVVPVNWLGRATALAGIFPIYQTGQLPVPNDVLFRLPNTSTTDVPDAPLGTRWGWKQRGPIIQYTNRKADIDVEFVCAAWSDLLYPTDAHGVFTF